MEISVLISVAVGCDVYGGSVDDVGSVPINRGNRSARLAASSLLYRI